MGKKILVVTGFLLFLIVNSTHATTIVWQDPSITGYYQTNITGYFMPNTNETIISGTLDISGLAAGAVEMFGLIDKQLYDNSGYTFMSGAYIYVYKTATDVKIGTSDGNLGGEITSNASSVGATNTVDFTLAIFNNNIELTSSLFTGTKTSTYGTVKTLNNAYGYVWDEFEFGAYLAGNAYPDSTVGIDITASDGLAPVPEPATMLLLGTGIIILGGIRRRFKK